MSSFKQGRKEGDGVGETLREFMERIREQGKAVTVNIDETGNFGRNFIEFPVFGVGATLIEKPQEFALITVKWRGKKTELKYRKTNKDKRVKIESDVDGSGAAAVGVYYDKKDVPNWKKLIQDQSQLHQDMIQ
jgi:hypothetical protein